MSTLLVFEPARLPRMSDNFPLASLPPIRNVIVRGLHPHATPGDIKQLVNLCHKAAIAYLRPKAAMYRRMMDGLTIEEVSLDAIADLFEQRCGTGFPKLAQWLNRNSPIDQMTDDTLWVEFRRIILGAVNQHLYRMFRHADPSLSRILRNLKLALKTHPRLRLMEINRIAPIALKHAEAERRSCPEILPELLEAEFQARSSSDRSLKTMLGTIEAVLREETDYRDAVPLTVVALMFRSRTAGPPVVESIDPSCEELTEEEIVGMIDGTLDRLRPAAVRTYLQTDKLLRPLLESHLRALREILVSSISGGGDGHATYLRTLQKHIPGITNHQYQTRDRRILEYLARQARRELKIIVMKDLGISGLS